MNKIIFVLGLLAINFIQLSAARATIHNPCDVAITNLPASVTVVEGEITCGILPGYSPLVYLNDSPPAAFYRLLLPVLQ